MGFFMRESMWGSFLKKAGLQVGGRSAIKLVKPKMKSLLIYFH